MPDPVAKALKWLLVALLLGVTAWQLHISARILPVVDLVEYWSAARSLVHGENPYSPSQMFVVEKSAGWSQADPLLMWNPPWALAFVTPMGWLSYRATYLLWLAINFGIVVLCANRLLIYYGGSRQKPYVAWIIALTFVPTLTVLGLGQIGPLILFGITMFLLWRDTHPWLAGAATVLSGSSRNSVICSGLRFCFGSFVKGVGVFLPERRSRLRRRRLCRCSSVLQSSWTTPGSSMRLGC